VPRENEALVVYCLYRKIFYRLSKVSYSIINKIESRNMSKYSSHTRLEDAI